MHISAFWTKLPKEDMFTDLIGTDAVHEAIAAKLLPLLTGGTPDVEHYLYFLYGIKWARETASLKGFPTDKEVQDNFLAFENALKLNWVNEGHNGGFRGVQKSKTIIEGIQNREITWESLNLHTERLIKNQAAQGLYGAHSQPARRAGLVSKDPLELSPHVLHRFKSISWHWSPSIHKNPCARFNKLREYLIVGNRKWLKDQVFENKDFPVMKEMYSQYARKYRTAPPWRKIALTSKSAEVREYAAFAPLFAEWFAAANNLFDALVKNESHSIELRDLKAATKSLCLKKGIQLLDLGNYTNKMKRMLFSKGTEHIQALVELHNQVQRDRGNPDGILVTMHKGKPKPTNLALKYNGKPHTAKDYLFRWDALCSLRESINRRYPKW